MIERAHLKDARDGSHVMYRYEPEAELEGLVQRFWIPVWTVPPGEEAPQRVLQYPVCLLVITGEYARFYGVVSGLSTTRLAGDGWAAGVMLAPAARFLLAGASVAAYTDRFVDLSEVLELDGVSLVERVRDAMRRTRTPPKVMARRWRRTRTRCGRFCPSTQRASSSTGWLPTSRATATCSASPSCVTPST